MAGNDKTMRAFVRGALIAGTCGFALSVFMHGIKYSIFQNNDTLFIMRMESVFGVAPWLLIGGVLGLARHFFQERRVQFSILLLLLVTLLFSFSGAWGVLARSRYQAEQEAVVALEESLAGVGNVRNGFFFPAVTEVVFFKDSIDSASISFFIEQVKLLPELCKVTFYGKIISGDDLATLRVTFPNVVFERVSAFKYP